MSNEIRFDDIGSGKAAAMVSAVRFLCDFERTDHFFNFTNTVDGPQHERNYQRFLASPTGQALDAENVNFLNVLFDRQALERYPTGSLAMAYLEFLDTENISLKQLRASEEEGAASRTLLNTSRRNFISAGTANHDLLHVLTGYGRDALGEAMLLSLTAAALKLSGVGLIASAMVCREMLANPTMPVLAMANEARARGRKMVWLPEIDWRVILPLAISDARDRLQIMPADLYAHFNRTGPGVHAKTTAKKDSNRGYQEAA